MSLFAFGCWFVSFVRRAWRRGAKPTPHSGLPEWPVGASVRLCFHQVRHGTDDGFDTKPPTVRIVLTRDEVTGKVCDGNARELAAAGIYPVERPSVPFWRRLGSKYDPRIPDVRQRPEEMLGVFDSHVFEGQIVRLVFVDAVQPAVTRDFFRRAGVTIVDATCVWIESPLGFLDIREPESLPEAELAVA